MFPSRCSDPATSWSSRVADALTYLHSQISQDIRPLAVGESAWTFVLEPTGKVAGFARVDARRRRALRARHRRRVRRRACWRALDRFKIRVKVATALEPACESRRRRTRRGGPDRASDGRRWAARSCRARRSRRRPGWLGIAVNFTKGCYPGQELVERMDSRAAEAPRSLRRLDRGGGHATRRPGDRRRRSGRRGHQRVRHARPRLGQAHQRRRRPDLVLSVSTSTECVVCADTELGAEAGGLEPGVVAQGGQFGGVVERRAASAARSPGAASSWRRRRRAPRRGRWPDRPAAPPRAPPRWPASACGAGRTPPRRTRRPRGRCPTASSTCTSTRLAVGVAGRQIGRQRLDDRPQRVDRGVGRAASSARPLAGEREVVDDHPPGASGSPASSAW